MPFDHVAIFQLNLILRIGQIFKMEFLAILSDDELCTGPLVGSIIDQFFEAIEIEWGHGFWNSEVKSNGPGYPNLIKLDVWIRRDN